MNIIDKDYFIFRQRVVTDFCHRPINALCIHPYLASNFLLEIAEEDAREFNPISRLVPTEEDPILI